MTVPYMGLSSIRIDTNRLREQAQALRIIAIDFEGGDTVKDELKEAVGRYDSGAEDLRKKVVDATNQWSARRHGMRENIEKLQSFTETIAQEFDKLDQDMARALNPDRSTTRNRDLPIPNGSGGPQ